jgi:hypothetical protein
MKKLAIGLLASAALIVSAATPALANHNHTHNLDTPGNGDPVLAAGFCQENAHTGFSNFHSIVHAANGFDGAMAGSGVVEITSTNGC